MDSFKGFRTLLVGLGVAIGPVAFTYLSGVDWSQYVSPQWVPVITGAVMIGMRVITTGPVGGAKSA